LNASSRLALLTDISVGTKRRMLPVPLLSRAFELVWRRRVHHPDVSRLVEFQRESPCLMEHARSDWMRVHDSCGNRAAPVKDIQAQFCAAREGTGCVDHAAVVTHLDGPEISGKCTERIWAAHEEWSAVRNPLAPPMLSPVDRICHSLIRPFQGKSMSPVAQPRPRSLRDSEQRRQFIGETPHALAKELVRDGGPPGPGL